jgi:hypothetical protein
VEKRVNLPTRVITPVLVCGSRNVQLALAIDELADDDPLIAALIKLAEDGTD